jgi:predicted Zn-dependent protease
LRCQATLGQGDFERALAIATDLSKAAPGTGLAEFYLGAALQALRRPEEAEAQYLAALQVKPDAVEPLAALVRLYLGGNRAPDAERLLLQATTRTPGNAVAQNLLAQVMLTAGRPQDALQAFSRAIELRPNWPLPYRGLATAQRNLGERAAAEASYRRGIAATHDEDLYIDLALLLDEAARYDEAVAALEEGIVHHADSLVLANNLAMVLVTRPVNGAGLERAQALVAKLTASDDPAYLDTVGWVYYKAGRLDDAEAQLARAVAKQPTSPLLRYHYAQVLADRGAVERARSELDAALKATEFSERERALALEADLERRGGAATDARAGA